MCDHTSTSVSITRLRHTLEAYAVGPDVSGDAAVDGGRQGQVEEPVSVGSTRKR